VLDLKVLGFCFSKENDTDDEHCCDRTSSDNSCVFLEHIYIFFLLLFLLFGEWRNLPDLQGRIILWVLKESLIRFDGIPTSATMPTFFPGKM
jgi:hypothetical protein